jgi:hypothetical protein
MFNGVFQDILVNKRKIPSSNLPPPFHKLVDLFEGDSGISGLRLRPPVKVVERFCVEVSAQSGSPVEVGSDRLKRQRHSPLFDVHSQKPLAGKFNLAIKYLNFERK